MKHERMKHEQSRKGPGAGIEAATLMFVILMPGPRQLAPGSWLPVTAGLAI